MSGKDRDDLEELEKDGKVNIIVDDAGAYGTAVNE